MDLFMSLLRSVSWICQLSCLSCFITHTPSCSALLWLDSIQRKESDLQWLIDRCTVYQLPLPGYSSLLLPAPLTQNLRILHLTPLKKKKKQMLYSWRLPVWLAEVLKPQWTTLSIRGQIIATRENASSPFIFLIQITRGTEAFLLWASTTTTNQETFTNIILWGLLYRWTLSSGCNRDHQYEFTLLLLIIDLHFSELKDYI